MWDQCNTVLGWRCRKWNGHNCWPYNITSRSQLGQLVWRWIRDALKWHPKQIQWDDCELNFQGSASAKRKDGTLWVPCRTRNDWFFHNLTSLSGSSAISYSNKNLIVHKADVIRVENFLLRLQGGRRQLRLSDLQVTVSIVVLSLWYVLVLYLDLLMVSVVAGWAEPCVLLSLCPLDFLNLLGFQCLECNVFPLVQYTQI